MAGLPTFSSLLEKQNRLKGNCPTVIPNRELIFPDRYESYLLGTNNPIRKKLILLGKKSPCRDLIS